MIKKYNKIKDAVANLKKLEELTTNLNVDKGETLKEILGIELDSIEVPTHKPKIDIKFINKSDNDDPNYFHEGDSGFDLRAYLPNYDPLESENLVVESGKVSIISTGLYFEIPRGYELQIRPRSGLAAKFSITVLNTPGTVDSNYRGEIKVILINLGETDFQIENGDRIAQGVIVPVLTPEWSNMTKVNKLNPTSRNTGGFGSTGKK
jgi:dUTP pyrophosphatase